MFTWKCDVVIVVAVVVAWFWSFVWPELFGWDSFLFLFKFLFPFKFPVGFEYIFHLCIVYKQICLWGYTVYWITESSSKQQVENRQFKSKSIIATDIKYAWWLLKPIDVCECEMDEWYEIDELSKKNLWRDENGKGNGKWAPEQNEMKWNKRRMKKKERKGTKKKWKIKTKRKKKLYYQCPLE